MILVTVKKSGKGFRLEVKNQNSNIFNHNYNRKVDSKRAWRNFEKQVKAGKVKFVND